MPGRSGQQAGDRHQHPAPGPHHGQIPAETIQRERAGSAKEPGSRPVQEDRHRGPSKYGRNGPARAALVETLGPDTSGHTCNRKRRPSSGRCTRAVFTGTPILPLRHTTKQAAKAEQPHRLPVNQRGHTAVCWCVSPSLRIKADSPLDLHHDLCFLLTTAADLDRSRLHLPGMSQARRFTARQRDWWATITPEMSG